MLPPPPSPPDEEEDVDVMFVVEPPEPLGVQV
jgi:hypothetical protein